MVAQEREGLMVSVLKFGQQHKKKETPSESASSLASSHSSTSCEQAEFMCSSEFVQVSPGRCSTTVMSAQPQELSFVCIREHFSLLHSCSSDAVTG